MSTPATGTDRAAAAATFAAAAMIAQQVAGKAARDAFFLSELDIAALPNMIIASAAISVIAVRGLAHRMTPRRVPLGFATSAALLLVQWVLAVSQPRWVAVALYLHMAVFGSILISGFWALVTERFDPRSARRHMSGIASGATLGGFVGGLLAERIAALLSVTAMLPTLAALHLLCAVLVSRLVPERTAGGAAGAGEAEEAGRAARVLRRDSYLRHLAYLVLLGAIGAALIDFMFKARVVAAYDDGEDLMRFFAVYYTAVGLLTFVLQAALSRHFLERLGLARTVATLPGAVAAGSLLMLLPGLAAAAIARGAEAVLRSSLFRSGYELLYAPVPPADKRAAKTTIDVLVERLGDAVGGGMIKLLLLLGPVVSKPAILGVALVVGSAAIHVCRLLRRGHLAALERSLLRQRPEEKAAPVDIHEALLVTQDQLRLQSVLLSAGDLGAPVEVGLEEKPQETSPAVAPAPGDAVVARLAELRSADAARVRRGLVAEEALDPCLVPQVIRLLAWDDVAAAAARRLAGGAETISGQLGDALLDPDEDFVVRRRLPGVLASTSSDRAARALFDGLGDRRFEVRFRCARALVRIHERRQALPLSPEEVFAAVLREVRVGRRIWEGHRVLDRLEDESPMVDAVLRRRAGRNLEHVFVLLSLVLPREPLKVAFRALHTDDPQLAGTALEYLESVLPGEIRERLWPFLEEPAGEAPPQRSRQEVLATLMKANESILVHLEELRGRKPGAEPDP